MGRTSGAIVALGAVIGSYGVRGWIKVRPSSDAADMLLGHSTWWLKPASGSDWREFARTDGRMHSGALVAELSGVITREAALGLKGCEVGIPRAALDPPSEGELYWDDLIGLVVVNREGVSLGAVSGVTEHGAHPLLRVARPAGSAGPDRLIPYVPAIVDRVDIDANRIDVDWGEDY